MDKAFYIFGKTISVMKCLLFFCAFLLHKPLFAQYYYKDIIGTKESAMLLKTYKAANVAVVQVTSYDADNTRDDAFFVAQTFSKPHARLLTQTRSTGGTNSFLTTIADTSGRIIETKDSSETLQTASTYTYNNYGLLEKLQSQTIDSAKKMNETEVHLWFYENNLPMRMLRIVNGQDTTFTQFKIENGKVAEEQSTRKGLKQEAVYYYYNAAGNLTDIVRYNARAQRLLPEYMFEYDASGNVIQKITVPANGSDYLIWRYQYNAGGLKIKEAIYDKSKKLLGKIEYNYSKA